MLIPLCFIIFCMYFVQKRWLLAQNDSQRIEAITKGPINTKLGSAIDGLDTIRAYQKERYFINGFMNDSDNNGNAMFTFFGISRHMGVLLDMLSLVFIFINALLIVILRNHTNSLDLVTAAVSLQFSLEISLNFSFAVRFWTEADNLMVSGQRTIEYAEMKSEDEISKSTDPLIFSGNSWYSNFRGWREL